VVLRVAVVGGGIIGASIARELSLRQHRVILLEKGSLGGAVTGASLACLSTHMNSRLEIEILKWSCSAWAELNDELGQTMEYTRCGQLRFVERDEDLEVARDWISFERNAGLITEILDPSEVRKIEPLLEGPIIAATWASNAATVTPFLAVRAIIKDAVRHGLNIQCHSAVQDFIQRDGRIAGVITDTGAIEADVIVLACGPWTGELAARIGLDLPILPRKAQCLATVGLPPTVRTVIAACESAGGVVAGYTQIQQAPSGQVLFNTVLGGGLSEAGSQNTISEVDPVFVCNSIRQLLWLFPSLSEVELLRSWVRYEAVTPDDRFIVGPSSVPGLYIAAGDGGSGFGRAPAIARAVADFLEGREPPFNAALWSPDRFVERIAA
jgi:glycine/D-amino acid oxidase-like deaminating enzyme